MDYGLMTEPQLGMTYAELRDAARFAERIGLSVFARSDHFDVAGFDPPHATEAFATLAGLAVETSTIDLCVLVSPITFRHPGLLAKTAATIDEMSGGRLVLGVGTGWMEEEHDLLGFDFPGLGERFDRFEEALAYLRAAFDPAGPGFEGRHYRLQDRPVRPIPGRIPLVVGGSGPRRTPRLAGTYADEFNVFAGDPDRIRQQVAAARDAAARAGRDPSALRISLMGPAITGTDRSAYRDNLARIAAAHPFGRSPEELETRMAERGLPVGSPEQAAGAIAAFADAGIERFYVQHLGPWDHDLLEDLFAGLRG